MSGPGDIPASERDLGLVPGFLRPSVDLVARLKTTVHLKLLAGFLVIALLLLLMGILSIVVIGRMNQQVDQLVALQTQTDLARQAIYSVTAQSHYRAMALITEVDSWNDSVDTAKANFTEDVDQIDSLGAPIDPRSHRPPSQHRRPLRRCRRRGAAALRGGRSGPGTRRPHLGRARDLP